MKIVAVLIGLVFLAGCEPMQRDVVFSELENCRKAAFTGATVGFHKYTVLGNTRSNNVYLVTCTGDDE